MALTEAQIKRHMDSDEGQTIRDSRALFLRIGDTGASWVCRHTRNGKTTKTTLRRYPFMSTAATRRERSRITGINTDLGVTESDAVDDYRRLVSGKLKSGWQSDDAMNVRSRLAKRTLISMILIR